MGDKRVKKGGKGNHGPGFRKGWCVLVFGVAVILADDETSGAKALNNEESAILEGLEHIFDGLGDKNQDGKGLTEGATGVGGVGKGIVAIRRYHPAKRHDT